MAQADIHKLTEQADPLQRYARDLAEKEVKALRRQRMIDSVVLWWKKFYYGVSGPSVEWLDTPEGQRTLELVANAYQYIAGNIAGNEHWDALESYLKHGNGKVIKTRMAVGNRHVGLATLNKLWKGRADVEFTKDPVMWLVGAFVGVANGEMAARDSLCKVVEYAKWKVSEGVGGVAVCGPMETDSPAMVWAGRLATLFGAKWGKSVQVIMADERLSQANWNSETSALVLTVPYEMLRKIKSESELTALVNWMKFYLGADRVKPANSDQDTAGAKAKSGMRAVGFIGHPASAWLAHEAGLGRVIEPTDYTTRYQGNTRPWGKVRGWIVEILDTTFFDNLDLAGVVMGPLLMAFPELDLKITELLGSLYSGTESTREGRVGGYVVRKTVDYAIKSFDGVVTEPEKLRIAGEVLRVSKNLNTSDLLDATRELVGLIATGIPDISDLRLENIVQLVYARNGKARDFGRAKLIDSLSEAIKRQMIQVLGQSGGNFAELLSFYNRVVNVDNPIYAEKCGDVALVAEALASGDWSAGDINQIVKSVAESGLKFGSRKKAWLEAYRSILVARTNDDQVEVRQGRIDPQEYTLIARVGTISVVKRRGHVG